MKKTNRYIAKSSLAPISDYFFAAFFWVVLAAIPFYYTLKAFMLKQFGYANEPLWSKIFALVFFSLFYLAVAYIGIREIGKAFAVIQIEPEGIVYRSPLHRKKLLEWKKISQISLTTSVSSKGYGLIRENVIVVHKHWYGLSWLNPETHRTWDMMIIKYNEQLYNDILKWYEGVFTDDRV